MENFAPAILSKAASDIPADRLQWLHIINFFLSLTPSVPGPGLCWGSGKGQGQHTPTCWEFCTWAWQNWTGSFNSSHWSHLKKPGCASVSPFARRVLWAGHCEKIKQTSWHNGSQLFRSPQPVSKIKSRLLNADNEDLSLCISVASWGFSALFERFSKFQVVERQLYSETENLKSTVSF